MSEELLSEEFLRKSMQAAEQVWMSRIPPEAALSHRFSRRFLRKMRALLRYERHSVRGRAFVSGFRRLAAALLLALGIGTILTMSVEAYREKLFEIIMEVFPEFTSIRTSKKDASAEYEFVPMEPDYVPEGYEVEEMIEDPIGLSVVYINQEKQRITYEQTLLGTGETILDTEDAQIDRITIKDQEIQIIEKNNWYILWWTSEWYEFSIVGGASLEELKTMAETVI